MCWVLGIAVMFYGCKSHFFFYFENLLRDVQFEVRLATATSELNVLNRCCLNWSKGKMILFKPIRKLVGNKV